MGCISFRQLEPKDPVCRRFQNAQGADLTKPIEAPEQVAEIDVVVDLLAEAAMKHGKVADPAAIVDQGQ